MKFLRTLTLVTTMLTLQATAPLAQAADTTLISTIKLSFLGLTVGKLNSKVKVGPSNYSVTGYVKTSGLAQIITKTRANVSSNGVFAGGRVIPAAHALSFQTRKKSGKINMAFASGNVTNSVSTPKVKYKQGAIPLKKTHLNSVLDPLSSIIFPVAAADVGNGRKICNRTVPIFDGKARYNLVSRYKKSSKARVKGFKGKVYTCALRYQPISGLRTFKKNVKFMKANRDLEITVARVGETNVYTLFAFKVKTQKGTAKGYATKFISG